MERRRLIVLACSVLALGLASPAWADRGSDDGGGGSSGHGGGDDGGGDDGSHGGDDTGGDDNGGDDGGGDDGGDDGSHGGGGGGSSGSGRGGSSGSGRGGRSGDGQVRADIVAVSYADGSLEAVENGTYLRRDAGGRVVERRRGTRDDLRRLDASRIAPGIGGARGEMLVRIDSRTGTAETVDRRGWRETMGGGVYQLTDPRGNVVRRRALREDDLARVRALAP